MTNQPASPRPNPIAKDLRTPKYRPRVVQSRRVYKRKPRTGKNGR